MSPGFVASNSVFDQLSKPVVLVGLALLVGTLVLIFFPSADRLDDLVVNPAQGSFPLPTNGESVALPTADPEVIKQDVPPEITEASATSNMTPNVTPNVTPNGSPMAAPPAQLASSPALVVKPESVLAPVLVPTAPVSSAGPLVFKSRDAAWVEVVDAKGVSQLRRNLEAGETVAVSGALPLSVVVGRADAVEMQLRGKPFDLQAVSKANVARFEVK
jgi:cytoskeleton protein RodZ